MDRDPFLNQIIVNEYWPGEGISPHVDKLKFADGIVSVSLGSTCAMIFRKVGGTRVGRIDGEARGGGSGGREPVEVQAPILLRWIRLRCFCNLVTCYLCVGMLGGCGPTRFRSEPRMWSQFTCP